MRQERFARGLYFWIFPNPYGELVSYPLHLTHTRHNGLLIGSSHDAESRSRGANSQSGGIQR